MQRLVQDSAYYSKLSRVLFSVWFIIQGNIQSTTCSVWFRIQRIIKKCPGYYSASGSVFRVLFKIRPAASGSGFSVLFKNVQGIIQRLVPYSEYYSKYDLQRLVQDSAYYSKLSRELFSVWFSIQGIIQNTTCSVWFRIQRIIQNGQGIIQRLVQYSGYYSKYELQRLVQDSAYYSKCPGYYSASGSVCRVLFEIRAAASGSGFSVLLKNVQGIIQRLVQYSWYYSKSDLQRLVQDSAYYSKMSKVLFTVWFSIQGIIQNTTCSVWFRIQRIIKKCPGYYSASGSVFRVLFKIRPAASCSGFSVLFKNVQGIIQRLVQYSWYYSKYVTCSV